MDSLGTQLLIDLINCDPKRLDDVVFVEQAMEKAAVKAGATIINSTFHYFSPYGVSGVVVIQESHLAIHTWPEYKFAALDIFTCGETMNPWTAFEILNKDFAAQDSQTEEIQRGKPDNLLVQSNYRKEEGSSVNASEKIKRSRDVWFTARNEHTAFSLKHLGKKLFDHQSPFQKIEIYPTTAFGNMLTLDGKIMTTERDESAYHEMLVHIPMQTQQSPKNVLIIGGGDGGAVREVLRYENLEIITVVEIDSLVVEASRKYFPTLGNALADQRVNIIHQDGFDFIKEQPSSAFDVVLVDMLILEKGKDLKQPKLFFQQIRRILSVHGVVTLQGGSPYFEEQLMTGSYNQLCKIFAKRKVFCYLSHVPTYPGGIWSFFYASKGNSDPLKDFNSQKADDFSAKQSLKYYNGNFHKAAFALPNFVISLLNS